MIEIRVPGQSWVIVCDGAKALILKNSGNAGHLDLTVVEALDHPDAPDRELGTDRPGRLQTAGLPRSAVEETDLHQQAEANFLKEVAGRIANLAGNGADRDIFLIAPPKALGMLRTQFSTAVRASIRAEIAKDLVHMPVDDIKQHLKRIMF